MPTDLTLLGWSIVLGFVHILAPAGIKLRRNGVKWGIGPRDEPKTYTGLIARLDRAQQNFLETFPFFAVAILVAHVAGKTGATSSCSSMVVWGAELYFWSRILYLPLYAFAIPVARSAIWAVSLAGIVMVLLALC